MKNNPLFQEEPEIKPCADNMQVCTSLFRYDPQTVLREGQYCACSGCSNPVWDEEDGMSITWYHHERGISSIWNCVNCRAVDRGDMGMSLSRKRSPSKATMCGCFLPTNSFFFKQTLSLSKNSLTCTEKYADLFLNPFLFRK